MCKKKVVFPVFGTAADAQPEQAVSLPNPVYHPSHHAFYGAVFNILSIYLRNSLTTAAKDEFDTAFHAADGEFSMYFYLNRNSEIDCDLFGVPTKLFFQTINDVVADKELYGVRTIQKGSPDSPIFILKCNNMSDLMELTETLLTPYNMDLLTFSFVGATRTPEQTDGGLQFNILYSLPHVKMLYDVARGVVYRRQGMHLSH